MAEPAAAPRRDEWSALDVSLGRYFDPEEVEGWAGYRATKRSMGALGLALGLGFYVVMLGGAGRRLFAGASGLARRLGELRPFRSSPATAVARLLERLFGADWAGSMLYVWGYFLIGALLASPLWVLSELVDRREGLSSYAGWEWVVDLAKAEGMALASLSILAFGLFGLVRRMPRRWWIAVGGAAAGLLLLWAVVSPYRTRLFHEVRPLEDQALRARLEELAARQGVELTAVHVVEASRVTRAMDAYVTGEGPTRELVLYDTLLEGRDQDEVVVAVAHELAHEARRRPGATHVATAGATLLLLWILAVALREGARRLPLHGPGDVRALPLAMLVVSCCLLAARPARVAWSRHEERLADRAALAITADPEAFVGLQVALARANHADLSPPPWTRLWYGSHPSVAERIGTALWYRRWLDRPRAEPADAARRPLREPQGREVRPMAPPSLLH